MRPCRPPRGSFLFSSAEKVAEQFYSVVVVSRGDFSGGEYLYSRHLAGGGHSRTAFHGIVVGERHRRQTATLGFGRQRLRRIGPVRKDRVQVQIGKHSLKGGVRRG